MLLDSLLAFASENTLVNFYHFYSFWLLLQQLRMLAIQWRCGSHLVSRGDTKQDVYKQCGEPEYIEVVSSIIERYQEEWYDNSGAVRFPRVLTFEGYRLTDMTTVSRRLN
jgi:Protein of unknown function (DUF2845)